MTMHSKHRNSLGLQMAPAPCPRCGKPMIVIPCKCPFRRKGWALCAKCLNPACAHQMGLVKRRRGDRKSIGGLYALAQQKFIAAVPQAQASTPKDESVSQTQIEDNPDANQKPTLTEG